MRIPIQMSLWFMGGFFAWKPRTRIRRVAYAFDGSAGRRFNHVSALSAGSSVTPITLASRWPATARTTDGVTYHIRPIEPQDAELERAFIIGLSPESRFQRLMYTLREPSDEFIAHLVNVDRHRNMALVALHRDGSCEKIIGVARYAADTDGQDCEFAVAVADAWQCRGVGSTLTKLLFEYAAREGFRSIYGTVLADNQRMLELAEWMGLSIEPPTPGQSTVRASRRLN
jgi:acetyltransferase